MNEQHDKQINDTFFEPKEGQCGLLCCNKKSFRCPSFGINPNHVLEDVALNYFASILVEAYLDKKENERNKLQDH